MMEIAIFIVFQLTILLIISNGIGYVIKVITSYINLHVNTGGAIQGIRVTCVH